MKKIIKKIFNFILFPLRALFMLNNGFLGLDSIKEERMQKVEMFCKGKVLDIGCGPNNEFIKRFIGNENGVGIDVFPYEGGDNIVEYS